MSLITYRVDRFDPERFDPPKRRGQITVEFKETLYDPKQQKGMVRSVVREDNLVQDFWIEIVRKEKLWHIRPAKGCSIIPTAGIQRALDLVYNSTSG
jgi:tRNA (guanine-N7-)-methyltransferase